MKHLNNKGFTLLEIMITIIIVAIVFGLVANIVGVSTKFFTDESSQQVNQENVRITSVMFDKDVRTRIQSVADFNIVSGCYNLGASSPDIYCYNSGTKQVTRNGSVIAKSIQTFNAVLDSTENSILLTIRSVADNRGNTNEIIVKIYLRF